MRTSSLALLLIACDAEPDRTVSVVTGEADDPVAEWRPTDTGDTGEPLLTQSCGASWAESAEGDLPLLSCARITPEPEDALDTGIFLDSGLPEGAGEVGDAPPPPCGFFNLLGAVDLTGSASAPTLVYCDADADGGLRRVAIDAASGGFETELLAPGACWVDLQSGGQLQTDDGPLLLWTDLAPDEREGVSTMVYVAPATAAPPITDAAWVLEGTENALGLHVLAGDTPALVVQDTDNAVRLLLLSSDGAEATDSVEIAPVAASFGAAVSSGFAAIAACIDDTALTVTGVDIASASALWTHTITDAACGWSARPGVAVDAGRVAVVWDNDDKGWLALLDEEGQEIVIEGLGKESLDPAVAIQGEQIVTVDATGEVGLWSWDGALLGAWTHRAIADRLGTTTALQLLPGDDALSFLLIGQDFVSAGTGHINTYYYLEASTSAALVP